MFTLNLARISGLPLGSLPARALARAVGYHIPGNGAFGKIRATLAGDAAPSVPAVSVQLSASQLARIVIVGALFSVAPQIFAAVWKAMSRCCPSVVPPFPPTGADG